MKDETSPIILVGIILLFSMCLLKAWGPYIQEQYAFNPSGTRPDSRDPKSKKLRKRTQSLIVATSDGETLHAWFTRNPTPISDHIVLFLHGNAGNLQYYENHIENIAKRHSVLSLDYRGFGFSSGGKPTENQFYLDMDAVLSRLKSLVRVPHSRIILHGYSMGCAGALYLASKTDDFASVILEAPFINFRDAALQNTPALFPLKPFMTPSFPNGSRAAMIRRTPVAIVHSKTDEVIHFADALDLFSSVKNNKKKFFVSRGKTHKGVHADSRIFNWVDSVLN